MKMMKIALRSPTGADYGEVEIPDEVIGPDAIRRGDMIFIRRTHDVYTVATCCIVPDTE